MNGNSVCLLNNFTEEDFKLEKWNILKIGKMEIFWPEGISIVFKVHPTSFDKENV